MAENKVCVYMLINKVTGERYIGQTTSLRRRIATHKFYGTHNPNCKVAESIKEHGFNNFEATVLCECNKNELDDKERYYINKLKPELNVNGGGRATYQAGYSHTDEQKEKARQIAKKQWQEMDEETKAKLRANLTGPKKGHPVSQETREKLRKASLGKKQSPETIAKRFAWRKEKCCSSVETNRDECNGVGEKMSYSSKCVASCQG